MFYGLFVHIVNFECAFLTFLPSRSLFSSFWVNLYSLFCFCVFVNLTIIYIQFYRLNPLRCRISGKRQPSLCGRANRQAPTPHIQYYDYSDNNVPTILQKFRILREKRVRLIRGFYRRCNSKFFLIKST